MGPPKSILYVLVLAITLLLVGSLCNIYVVNINGYMPANTNDIKFLANVQPGQAICHYIDHPSPDTMEREQLYVAPNSMVSTGQTISNEPPKAMWLADIYPIRVCNVDIWFSLGDVLIMLGRTIAGIYLVYLLKVLVGFCMDKYRNTEK